MVLFDDVDVSATVERTVGGNKEVIAKIIRAANRKTVHRISEELKKKQIESGELTL